MTAIALVGCAHIQEASKLHAVPLSKPKTTVAVVGTGYQLRAKRVGREVVTQVAKADYCAKRTTQKARGFKVVRRQVVGSGLVMEWVAGALLGGGGGFLLAQSMAEPNTADTAEMALSKSKSLRMYGGGMALVGTALLAAAIYQTSQVGTEKIDLGVRELKREGLARPCNLSRAVTGTVRLTFDAGLQLTAPVDATGHARVQLPDDLEARVKRDGGRGTLEVLGDWRSQRRIDVSRDGAVSMP